MKECERISSMYGDLHEQQIDSIAKEDALEHFSKCTDCREDFKWYRITIQALNNLEEVSPPEDFVLQLGNKLYATQPSRSYDSYLDYFRNLFSSSPYLPLPGGGCVTRFSRCGGVCSLFQRACESAADRGGGEDARESGGEALAGNRHGRYGLGNHAGFRFPRRPTPNATHRSNLSRRPPKHPIPRSNSKVNQPQGDVCEYNSGQDRRGQSDGGKSSGGHGCGISQTAFCRTSREESWKRSLPEE